MVPNRALPLPALTIVCLAVSSILSAGPARADDRSTAQIFAPPYNSISFSEAPRLGQEIDQLPNFAPGNVIGFHLARSGDAVAVTCTHRPRLAVRIATRVAKIGYWRRTGHPSLLKHSVLIADQRRVGAVDQITVEKRLTKSDGSAGMSAKRKTAKVTKNTKTVGLASQRQAQNIKTERTSGNQIPRQSQLKLKSERSRGRQVSQKSTVKLAAQKITGNQTSIRSKLNVKLQSENKNLAVRSAQARALKVDTERGRQDATLASTILKLRRRTIRISSHRQNLGDISRFQDLPLGYFKQSMKLNQNAPSATGYDGFAKAWDETLSEFDSNLSVLQFLNALPSVQTKASGNAGRSGGKSAVSLQCGFQSNETQHGADFAARLVVENIGANPIFDLFLLVKLPLRSKFIGLPEDANSYSLRYLSSHELLVARLFRPLNPGETFSFYSVLRAEPWRIKW